MATVLSPNKDDNEEQGNQPAPTMGGAAPVSVSGTTGGTPATTQGASKPTTSGRFTNLSDYLKANQPGQGQQSLGEKMAGKIQDQGSQFGKSIKTEEEKTAEGIQAAMQPTQQTSQYIQKVQEDPTQLYKGNKVDTGFQQLRDFTYGGPQQLQNQAQLQSGVQGVQQLAQQGGTEAGRFQSLRQMFGNPNYSTGQQRMDQLLLQGNQGDLQKLAGTQKIGAQLGQQLQGAQAGTQQAIQGAMGQAQQTQGAIRGALEAGATGINTQLGQEAATTQAQRQAAFDAEKENLGKMNLSDADLTSLGLSRGQRLYGQGAEQLNLGQYALQGQAATAQNVANEQEIAKINALKNLAGGTATQGASKIYGAQYGGLEKDPYKIAEEAKSGIQNQIAIGKQQYEQGMQQAQSDIDASTRTINQIGAAVRGLGVDPFKPGNPGNAEISAAVGRLNAARAAWQNMQNQYGGAVGEYTPPVVPEQPEKAPKVVAGSK